MAPLAGRDEVAGTIVARRNTRAAQLTPRSEWTRALQPTAGVTALELVRPSWSAELGVRARRHFVLTLIGTSAFVLCFFIGYFYVQQHPVIPTTVMPLTPLDRLIPFQPYALWMYLSLWIYLGTGPGLQKTVGDIRSYTLWMGALCVTGLVLFYLIPTRVPLVGADLSDSPMFSLLQRMDVAGNACPSMHVAAAVFTAIRVDDLLRSVWAPRLPRLVNLACCGLICYSTLAIKQHVVLDVLAGAALGVIFAMLSLRSRPAASRSPSDLA
jgi:membrane-associated phospholipid phosphatase